MKEVPVKNDGLYVTLDALLDTRLATLATLSPEGAAMALLGTKYHTRKSNDFTELCGVSREAFDEAYAKRDARIVKHSRMTYIPKLVARIMKDLEIQAVEGNDINEPFVDVNVWPYELSDGDKEALRAAVGHFTALETRVNIIDVPIKHMTPTRLFASYGGAVMYEWRDWMAEHRRELNKVRDTEFVMIAPFMFHGRELSQEEWAYEEMNPDVNPADLMTLAMIGYFELKPVDLMLFSIDRLDIDFKA